MVDQSPRRRIMRQPIRRKGRIGMRRRRFPDVRRGAIPVLASLLTGAFLAGFGMQASSAGTAQPDPVTACTNLAFLTKFPVTPTRITLAQFNPPGVMSTVSIVKALYHMLRDGTKFR